MLSTFKPSAIMCSYRLFIAPPPYSERFQNNYKLSYSTHSTLPFASDLLPRLNACKLRGNTAVGISKAQSNGSPPFVQLHINDPTPSNPEIRQTIGCRTNELWVHSGEIRTRAISWQSSPMLGPSLTEVNPTCSHGETESNFYEYTILGHLLLMINTGEAVTNTE